MKKLHELLTDVEARMRAFFRAEIEADNEPYPMMSIIVTKDPRTGEPIKTGYGELIVVAVLTDGDAKTFAQKDADKDIVAGSMRAIAIAGNAVATVFAAESWLVTGDDDIDRSKSLESHPGRKECIAITTNCRHDRMRNTLEHIAFTRERRGIRFEEPQRMTGVKLAGRFNEIMPLAEPPAYIVEYCRRRISSDPNIKMSPIE